MNKLLVKELAVKTAADGDVPSGVQEFVLSRMTRRELKQFLFHLKNEVRRQRVVVRAPSHPGDAVLKQLAALFPARTMHFEADASVGAGLQVEYGDNLVNYNIKSIIVQALKACRDTL
jgi:hypothetical protein